MIWHQQNLDLLSWDRWGDQDESYKDGQGKPLRFVVGERAYRGPGEWAITGEWALDWRDL